MIKVVSNENMRKSDYNTIITKTPSKELMFRAGKQVFDAIKWRNKVAIVCGSGNNAGDGYVLASLLHQSNYQCTIFLISEKFSNDGLYYFKKCQNEKVDIKIIDQDTNFDDYEIIVDAIFGTGFKGEIKKDISDLIDKINNSNKEVISIDINSGLNGDNGLMKNSVHSTTTVSIGYFKTGHFLNQAKDVMKVKINVEIGIDLVDNPYYLIEEKDIVNIFPKRLNYSNKSTYSYVALIGGSINYSGAIRLATLANGAMRSGAGVCSVIVPKSISNLIIPNCLESTVIPMDEENGHLKFNQEELDRVITKYKVIAFGMGITNCIDTKTILEYLLMNYEYKLLIDADGLNALAEIDDSYLLNKKCNVIITPHIMEFSRLLKIPIEEINNNPISYAQEYAKKYNLTLLLKGPTTIVTDGKTVYLVDKGCPGMATAGSGDVLSGIISGILGYNNNILLATAAGAFINGLAGKIAQDKYGDISMIASDTVNSIPEAIQKIRNLHNE